MKFRFSKEKLEKLLLAFYRCTGISISIFDSEYVCVADAGSPQMFCNMLRCHSHDMVERCMLSDKQHFIQANKQKMTITYTCHAGIAETITPIFYENIIIGYIMIGRFRDKEKVYSSPKLVKKAIENYGLDPQPFLKLYKSLPELSKDRIDSAVLVFQSCMQYIWSEHLIDRNRDLLPAKIESYINENLSSELSVKQICKTFYISKETLYTVFREEFNDTVKNFINNKRIKTAKNLLIETTSSISAIADEVGFSNYNYFIRLFKSKTGLSPLQFRKKNSPPVPPAH